MIKRFLSILFGLNLLAVSFFMFCWAEILGGVEKTVRGINDD